MKTVKLIQEHKEMQKYYTGLMYKHSKKLAAATLKLGEDEVKIARSAKNKVDFYTRTFYSIWGFLIKVRNYVVKVTDEYYGKKQVKLNKQRKDALSERVKLENYLDELH